MSDVWLPTMELDDGGDYQSLVDENEELLIRLAAAERERDALRAALEWYADPANWDEDGYAMDNLRGGYHTVDEWVDFDFDLDVGERARSALTTPPSDAAMTERIRALHYSIPFTIDGANVKQHERLLAEVLLRYRYAYGRMPDAEQVRRVCGIPPTDEEEG
jgi:hypothetical protein